MTGRDAEREQLTAAFAGVDCDPALDSRDVDELLSALLPVVDRIANDRAVAAEQRGYERGRRELAAYLNRIAPALRASNGAGTAT